MGQTVAENFVSETIKVMTQSITESTNECNANVSTQNFNIVLGGDSHNCTFNDTAKINTTVDMSCYASTNVQTSVTNDLRQAAQTMANSVNQQFAFLTFSEAINIVNGYINLSTIMETTFYNSCVTDISTSQTNVVNCQGSVNMAVDIDFEATTNLTQDCLFNNTAVNNAKNNIVQSVKAKATAEIQNYLAGIIAAVLGVLVVAGLVIFLIFLIFRTTGKKDQPPPVNQPVQQSGDDLFTLAALSAQKSQSPPRLTSSPAVSSPSSLPATRLTTPTSKPSSTSSSLPNAILSTLSSASKSPTVSSAISSVGKSSSFSSAISSLSKNPAVTGAISSFLSK